MAKITLKDVKAIGRELTVRKTEYGEYRVAYAIPAIQMMRDCGYSEAKEANEASAYYASDLEDAHAQALYMHNVYVNNPESLKGQPRKVLQLVIPAAWMKACGYGDKEATLPVIRTWEAGGWTFAEVTNRSGMPWVVNVEMRGARFIEGAE